MPPFENAYASLTYIIVNMRCVVNKRITQIGENAEKVVAWLGLLDVLLREIVQNPHTHFPFVRRGESLDGGAVKCRAEPLFGIEPGTGLFFLIHCITS